MGSSSKIIRRNSSCSFLNLLLSFSNFILFILSAASLAPTIFLKMPPTSLGYALLMISSISILSCLIGFYSQISQFCYITHVSLLVASSIGQLLGILALFTKEKSSLSMLRSPRDPRESKLLVRVECGVLMAMFVMQMGVFILSCAVHRHSCCQQRKIEMTTGNAAAAAADVKSKEMQGEIDKIKYGKLTKNDHLEA